MNRIVSTASPLGPSGVRNPIRLASMVSRGRHLHHQPAQQNQPPPSVNPSDYHHKSNLTTLPPILKSALTSVLSNPELISGPRIRSASLRIFDSLRSTTGSVVASKSAASHPKIPSLVNPDRHLSPHHLAYDHDTSLAYLAARFPACFTGIKRVLGEAIGKAGGSTGPRSVLDVGTGPGTAVWALRAVEDEMAAWRGEDPTTASRASVTAMDVNPNMLAVAKRLAAAGELQGKVEWAEYMPASLSASYDMSIAAYVLSEIEDTQLRQRLLKSMWRLTSDVLVLVDRGTPHGYQRMMEARDWFIAQSTTAQPGEPTATILAPCPHMAKCPLVGNGRDWCHFSQRMERPAETQRTKHAKTNLEDVKFSYLVVQKKRAAAPAPFRASTWPRVLSVPLKRGGHVLVDVCTPRGTADRMVVTKSLGKETYKAARKLGWGDQWPFAAKVYVPGRGMGRGEQEQEQERGAKDKKKMQADLPVEHWENDGVLFEVTQGPVPPPAQALGHAVKGETTQAESARRGGRAARGSKKPVSPFAVLVAHPPPSSAEDAAKQSPQNSAEPVQLRG